MKKLIKLFFRIFGLELIKVGDKGFFLLKWTYPYTERIARGVNQDKFPIFVRYPVHPEPRYGYGNKLHSALKKQLAQHTATYQEWVQEMLKQSNALSKISTEPENEQLPYWNNTWFTGLDAIALYTVIARRQPDRYIEIGSGQSTRFARQAIADHQLDTRITSVDPSPRSPVQDIVDQRIRQPLQEVSSSVFQELKQDDIVFFDGSHQCFMNSDVTVFFLETLCQLPKGVWIHLHDIHLPFDYPPERQFHYESEQYLLATLLLARDERFSVQLPIRYILSQKQLLNQLKPLRTQYQIDNQEGTSFWIKKVAQL